MDERHAVGETEADSAGAGLLGEERADVHARACESQITVPRAEHLARAAGEVEYPCPGGTWSACPRVANLSGVSGLWMRWLLSRIVKIHDEMPSVFEVRGFFDGADLAGDLLDAPFQLGTQPCVRPGGAIVVTWHLEGDSGFTSTRRNEHEFGSVHA